VDMVQFTASSDLIEEAPANETQKDENDRR
jgi:hypothetical protein